MSIIYKVKQAGPNLTSRQLQEIGSAQLTEATVDPAITTEIVTPPPGYDGFSSITVNGVTSGIDENIQPENIVSGVEILGVTGTYEPTYDTLNETITAAGEYTYTGSYSEVNISVEDFCDGPNLGNLTVSANGTYYALDSGYDGYSDVEVDVQPNLESVTETYTANGTYIIPIPTGYDGIDEVTVEVNVPGAGSDCVDWSSIGWDCNQITNSGLAADLAYSATLVGNIGFSNDSNLVIAPMPRNPLPYNNTQYMFHNCANLKYVPLFDTSTIQDTSHMFQNCYLLTHIPNFDFSRCVDAQYMFYGCANFSEIPNISFPDVRNTSYMFAYTDKLYDSVDWSKYPRAYVTDHMFEGSGIISFSATTFSATSCNGMFNCCFNLIGVTFGTNGLRSVLNAEAMFESSAIPYINVGTMSPTTAERLFYSCTALTAVDGTINFAGSASSAFSNCHSLTSLPTMDTSGVTNACYMFDYTLALTTIPELDFSSVEQVEGILAGSNVQNLGGFINLGKAFTDDRQITFDLSDTLNLTATAIVNVFDRLVAPDNSTLTPQINISSAQASMLTQSDLDKPAGAGWQLLIDYN